MLRIVVLNPKGGSGKSTIATGIAAMYAARGYRPVLMDFDPQGSALALARETARRTSRRFTASLPMPAR